MTDQPLCIDCAHLRREKGRRARQINLFPACQSPNNARMSLVLGHAVPISPAAEDCRADEALCGQGGAWFQPKEPRQ